MTATASPSISWLRVLGGNEAHAVPEAAQRSLCLVRSVSWVAGLRSARCPVCVGLVARGGAPAPTPHQTVPSLAQIETLEAVIRSGKTGLRFAMLDERMRTWLAETRYALVAGDPPRWYATRRGYRAWKLLLHPPN